MQKVLSWTLALTMAALAWSATPAKKKATTPRISANKPPSKSTGKKTAARATWRNRQLTPTPERYKEIQEALAAKGYLRQEEANGAWGPASGEALKRFQAEQNIGATGKINSLSLIALGLGPKREVAASQPPVPPAEPNGSR